MRFIENKQDKITGESGLTLIELALILAVAAILAVAFLVTTAPSAQTNADKTILTINRMNQINKAILNFRIKYNRLPCPAIPQLNVNYNNTNSSMTAPYTIDSTGTLNTGSALILNNFSFDDEALSITAAGGVDCPVLAGSASNSPQGAVPVRALGLPDDVMVDGWGNKFHYHVNGNFCGSDTTSTQKLQLGCTPRSYAIDPVNDKVANSAPDYYPNPYDTTKDLTVIVKDSTDTVVNGQGANVVVGTTTLPAAAYVLVSFGSDQYYGYQQSGVQNPGSLNADEILNGNGGNTYVKRPANLTSDSTRFDDIVMFVTKTQIENGINDYTTPLMSQANCTANSTQIAAFGNVAGIPQDNLPALPTIQNDMINDINPLQSGSEILNQTITANTNSAPPNNCPSANGCFSSNNPQIDLSIFMPGDQITVTGGLPAADNTASLNPAYYTVVGSTVPDPVSHISTLTVVPNIASNGTGVNNVTITDYNNNSYNAILSIMYTLQDACAAYYGTVTANDISFNGNAINSATTLLHTEGIAVGSSIVISGSANAATNGVYKVATVGPNTITITIPNSANPATLAAEAAGNRITLISKACPYNSYTAPNGQLTWDYASNACSQ